MQAVLSRCAGTGCSRRSGLTACSGPGLGQEEMVASGLGWTMDLGRDAFRPSIRGLVTIHGMWVWFRFAGRGPCHGCGTWVVVC